MFLNFTCWNSPYLVPLKETLVVSILSRLWFHHWFVLFNLWLKNIQTTHGMKKKEKGMDFFSSSCNVISIGIFNHI